MLRNILGIISLLFLFSLTVHSQPDRSQDDRPPRTAEGFHFEYSVYDDDSLQSFFFMYRIQNNLLVFKKNGGNYSGGFTLELELSDEDGNSVQRETVAREVMADDYESTRSEFLSTEGVISLTIKPGDYLVEARVFDNNSERTGKIKPIELQKESISKKEYYPPLIIETEKISCDNRKYFKLVNYRGAIPFNSENYAMLLPVKDLDKEKLKITIAGFRDSLVFESENSFVSNIDFFECSGDVAITGGKGKPVKIFLFSNFSNSLREGEYKVIILDSGEEEVSFPINVLWINKPGSMFNPERAISFLSFIENEETVDSLLDFEDSFYPKILYDYWQPKDPTPETAFNELMAEYYKRIDYARTAFATLKGNDGEKTDRAKILVRFGEPDDVTRSVTEDGFVTEIWNYGKLQKKFIFVDTSGKGKFELESAQ